MISSMLFLVIATGVFAYFSIQLKQTWASFAIGKGPEENRMDNPMRRMGEVLRFGLIQEKMFRDPVAGLMHAGIFWGFVIVSLGTVETLISGVFSSFSFATILGDGTLYGGYLLSQDIGNFLVAAAIVFAILRRLFAPPKRLASLGKDSRVDAYIVLGFILALVVTQLLVLGGKSLSGTIEASVVPISTAMASLLVSDPFNAMSFEGVLFWLHSMTLFGFGLIYSFEVTKHGAG